MEQNQKNQQEPETGLEEQNPQPYVSPEPGKEIDPDEEAHRQIEQNEETGTKIFSPRPSKLVEEERDLDEEAHRQLEQEG